MNSKGTISDGLLMNPITASVCPCPISLLLKRDPVGSIVRVEVRELGASVLDSRPRTAEDVAAELVSRLNMGLEGAASLPDELPGGLVSSHSSQLCDRPEHKQDFASSLRFAVLHLGAHSPRNFA